MTDTHYTPVLAFDPGAATGVAALDEQGDIIVTLVLSIEDLEKLLDVVNASPDMEVVVESSPEFGHHSPVTRRAERMILDVFQSAHRVRPGHWKTHPRSKRVQLPKYISVHEKDAVRLGRWFQQTGAVDGNERTKSTRSNNPGVRHKRK